MNESEYEGEDTLELGYKEFKKRVLFEMKRSGVKSISQFDLVRLIEHYIDVYDDNDKKMLR